MGNGEETCGGERRLGLNVSRYHRLEQYVQLDEMDSNFNLGRIGEVWHVKSVDRKFADRLVEEEKLTFKSFSEFE